jgi:hypothetical protein
MIETTEFVKLNGQSMYVQEEMQFSHKNSVKPLKIKRHVQSPKELDHRNHRICQVEEPVHVCPGRNAI